VKARRVGSDVFRVDELEQAAASARFAVRLRSAVAGEEAREEW
jgi:hypothetical protein